MTLRNAWQVGVCALAVASVGFFAACGDDEPEDCPYDTDTIAGECQYDGDNLVDCTGANEGEVCATGFDCLAEDGSGAVGATEDGICATNTAMAMRIELRLGEVDWRKA